MGFGLKKLKKTVKKVANVALQVDPTYQNAKFAKNNPVEYAALTATVLTAGAAAPVIAGATLPEAAIALKSADQVRRQVKAEKAQKRFLKSQRNNGVSSTPLTSQSALSVNPKTLLGVAGIGLGLINFLS